MSEKIIDEVMELVTSLWDSGNARESWDLQCAKYESIRAKLREVLERKQLSDEKKQELIGAWFAETWLQEKADGLLHDYELIKGS